LGKNARFPFFPNDSTQKNANNLYLLTYKSTSVVIFYIAEIKKQIRHFLSPDMGGIIVTWGFQPQVELSHTFLSPFRGDINLGIQYVAPKGA